MNWNFKKMWPTAAMSIAAFTAMLNADQHKYKDKQQPMRCDRPSICGPDMGMAVTPPARPFTDDACCCDSGEFSLEVAGFYWQATEDGLEYGIQSQVTAPTSATTTDNAANLVSASYETPDFKWKPGFKVGIGYNTTHDGWDLELLWTHFNGRGKSSIDNTGDANITFVPLWSAFSPAAGGDTDGTILFASEASTSWRLNLNMVDLELGREFWLSKMLTMRPSIGFRVAQINQRYGITYSGGIFGSTLLDLTDNVEMKNHFTGGGPRVGLDTVWNFGCCSPCGGNWGFFGDFAFSLLYGKFKVDQEEYTESPAPPFDTTAIMETNDNFRSVRGVLDLAVGIQWTSLFNDSNYGMLLQLGWEFHQFFNQNQMWRVNRIGDSSTTAHGENVFAQSRGDLSTQGVTLTAKFTF